MEVGSVSLLVVNKLPALQALALDYAEEEEDFVSFWIIVMSAKMFQILSLDYAAAEEEEEDSGSFSMISRNDDAIAIYM